MFLFFLIGYTNTDALAIDRICLTDLLIATETVLICRDDLKLGETIN